MNDFEARLSQTIRNIADDAPNGLDMLDAIETRIDKEATRNRLLRPAPLLAIAAVLAAAVAVVAIAERPTQTKVTVSHQGPTPKPAKPHPTPPTAKKPTPTSVAANPVISLPQGMALMAVRGQDVVALDANGNQVGILLSLPAGHHPGQAQLSADRQTLWYKDLAGPPQTATSSPDAYTCGAVMRYDLATHASTTMGHALAFAVSPDGSKLALSSELAAQPTASTWCPGLRQPTDYVYVKDLATNQEASLSIANGGTGYIYAPQVVWSPAGDQLAVQLCAQGCALYTASVSAPIRSGVSSGRLVPVPARDNKKYGSYMEAGMAWTASGLTVAEGTGLCCEAYADGSVQAIDRYNTVTKQLDATLLDAENHWFFEQVVVTPTATYVVAETLKQVRTPGVATSPTPWSNDGDPRLYQFENGKLTPVAAFGSGTLSAAS